MKSCFDRCVIEKKTILFVTHKLFDIIFSFQFINSIEWVRSLLEVHSGIFPEQCLIDHFRQVINELIQSFSKSRFGAY